METRSASPPVAPSRKEIANLLSLLGNMGFWVQLGLAVVSSLGLIFAFTGRNFTDISAAGIGFGIFWAVLSVLALGFVIILSFRYTRTAKRLRNPEPSLHPTKMDTVRLVQFGLTVSLIGILLALLGSGATLGVLIAKTISQPPGVAITNPVRIVRALDVFVMMSNIVAITGHFVGTLIALSLLHRLERQ